MNMGKEKPTNRTRKQCVDCKFFGGISKMCITMCQAPQNNSNHPDYKKYKDLFYTDKCPLREAEEMEFLYWN